MKSKEIIRAIAIAEDWLNWADIYETSENGWWVINWEGDTTFFSRHEIDNLRKRLERFQ